MQYIILWILALYGLWELVSRIIDSLYNQTESVDCEVIIKVLNQEYIIEKLIEDTMKIYPYKQVTVIDMGSTDSTLEILKKMKSENVKLHVIDRQR